MKTFQYVSPVRDTNRDHTSPADFDRQEVWICHSTRQFQTLPGAKELEPGGQGMSGLRDLG